MGLGQIHDPVMLAIPVFIVFLALEIVAIHVLHHDQFDLSGSPDAAARTIGYDVADTRTSLTMGIGYSVINLFWRLVVLVVYAAIYEWTPLRLSPHDWWTWVIVFFADDLAYYWFHRASHRIRFFWAGHVVHHSSQKYNFSTALRQKWTPMLTLPFWMPLALVGIPPWVIFTAMAWSLIYQFFLHTEKIRRMPNWFEAVFNTPSHHRVHHGSDADYLDVNYAGILIIWDRMFGSFVPETHRATYGLTKNIDTHNPIKVAFGEFVNIGRDVRTAHGVKAKLGYVFGPPGWQPATAERAAGQPAGQPAR
ncbi:MAG TPA: sterol desaturase family protein [Jatrophihabitans sp.]|jgi:sterol desaturase/sphingolipid hydroxylase (fatty acid hydroxylase superfamily)